MSVKKPSSIQYDYAVILLSVKQKNMSLNKNETCISVLKMGEKNAIVKI